MQRQGYPAKRDSKNDVSIITNPHSGGKHLENWLTRHWRDAFVNFFLRAVGELSHNAHCLRFYTAIQKLGSRTCEQLPRRVNVDQDLSSPTLNQFRCESRRIVYFLKPSAAPTIFRPARFWKRGERANRRRYARGRRFNQAIVGSRPIAIWER